MSPGRKQSMQWFFLLSRPIICSWFLMLPSLFTAWLFGTFHTKSHNMKTLVSLSYSWSPFLPLTCLYGQNEILGSLCGLLEYFLEKKIPQDYPCKLHEHDHMWADLVMTWLLYDIRKCEHKVYILLSTCQWVHMALAINRPDILLM